MKATEILDCIMYMGISGEELNKIEVPTKEDEWNPQTEEWWYRAVGACPPSPIDSGVYLLYYPNDARDFLGTSDKDYTPNVIIDDLEGGVIYLYKLED